jgi:hypothetical protein
VDKKSIDILENKETPKKFVKYLKNKLGSEAFSFLEELSSFSNVFIFSGVIRNYFIKYNGEIRDFDIVISSNYELVENFISKFNYNKNSFGGYKLQIGLLKIDLWHIEKTWAFTKQVVIPELFENYNLPNTAFFNFSSIIFDFKNHDFIFNSNFKRFLETKEMDLVLEKNPLPQLCIINTIYYTQKFRLPVSEKLKKYCLSHFNKYNELEYQNIQIKHFNEVKYPYSYLKTYMEIFDNNVVSVK